MAQRPTYPLRRRGRHVRAPSPLRTAGRAVAAVLVAVLLGAVLTGTVVWRKLETNLASEDLSGRLGSRPAAAATDGAGRRPLNLLLVGTDTRAGANGFVGGDEVDIGRSDTTILLHLSADRRWATGVSIPRDSMVDMPDCVADDGRTIPGGMRMFNAAYSLGGSACVQRTVEQLTGIRVDHHVVIDFSGFARMVDALGGVQVCVPKAVDDRQGNITLAAGRQTFKGRQALDYVRVRHGLDNTGDVGRMQRQQTFLSAMIQRATSTGVLTNPARLYRFLDAATRSITTDPKLASLDALAGLARQVKGIGLENIRFVTVPNSPWPQNRNRLAWIPDQAAALWQLLDDDKPLPPAGSTSATPATPGPGATPSTTGRPLVTPPARIRVKVVDASTDRRHGARAANALRRAGFQVVEARSAPEGEVAPGTVVRYDPGYDESARTLATAVTGATSEADVALSRTLELVVGDDYRGVQLVATGGAVPRPLPTPDFAGRTAAQDVCG